MIKENKTIVKTRKDFMDAFRSVFIPSCNKLFGKGGAESFNIGYALNNWTEFWIYVDENTYMVVELVED